MRTALVCVRTPVAAQSITTCASRLGVTTIRTAVSEAEALARLGEGPAELILVDTAVSRPDTVGFTRRVLALAPRAVLLLFGAEEPPVAAAAVAAGARGLIRTAEHDPVAVVTKALLLIGTPRRVVGPGAPPAASGVAAPATAATAATGPAAGTATGPAAGAAAPGTPGAAAPGTPGAAAPGTPGAAAPVGGSGAGRSGPAGTSLVLVPSQRADPPGSAGPAWRASLTERELQVLRGMAEGKSNAEIGRDLYVSEDTVKTHARRLFRKLRARDRAHAVAVGFRAGALR
ncbi:MAG: helix-turn-helix transcriptional regulator [Micromonosporaceae bacterium]|nr:helix-turn-helix transcriptional regulator [Micromonosporaceae bacterium]